VQRIEEKFEMYTLDDPSNWLPEEVGVYIAPAGVQFLQVNEEANTSVVLQSWAWDKIRNFKAIVVSDDPEDMELFRINVQGFGNFNFECDDAREIKQEMLYHMWKGARVCGCDCVSVDVCVRVWCVCVCGACAYVRVFVCVCGVCVCV
jgi:hypothetical protein